MTYMALYNTVLFLVSSLLFYARDVSYFLSSLLVERTSKIFIVSLSVISIQNFTIEFIIYESITIHKLY